MVGVLFLKCIIICCPFQELEMKGAIYRVQCDEIVTGITKILSVKVKSEMACKQINSTIYDLKAEDAEI